MVHGQIQPTGGEDAEQVRLVKEERVKLLTGMYEHFRGLLEDWQGRAGGLDDDLVTAVAVSHREFGVDLGRHVEKLWQEVRGSGLDTPELKRAREHLKMLSAMDPAKEARAVAEIRAGRFITLEQARRELRAETR